jgi:hypothetical protein
MRHASTLLALLVCSAAARAGLPAELDGSWFNPAQSGHGLTLERVDAGHAVLFWHTFDTEGRPLTLYVEGRIEGERISGTAYAPSGMRFGRFDPVELRLPAWGEISLTFSDCHNALLEFRALDPAFGNGSTALTRLLPLADPHCSLDNPSDLRRLQGYPVSGRLEGYFDGQADASGARNDDFYAGDLEGLVDASGAIYALVSAPADLGYETTGVAQMLVATPASAVAGRARLAAEVQRVGWLDAHIPTGSQADGPASPAYDRFELSLTTRQSGAAGHLAPAASDQTGGYIAVHASSRGLPLRAGSYRFDARKHLEGGGAISETFDLVVGSDDSLCVRPAAAGSECLYRGRVDRQDEGTFAFELRARGDSALVYRGVGQSRYRIPGQQFLNVDLLQLYGSDGQTGLYLRSSAFTAATP